MGTWSHSAGVWILAGDGTRTAAVSTARMPANSALKLQLTDPDHEVRAVLLSDRRGSTCWEAGIVGSNVVIRRVIHGAPQTPAQSAAHGLTSGVPFTLEVRLVDNAIQVRLDGAETAIISHTLAEDDGLGYFGFAAEIDQARVAGAEVCALTPITVQRASVLAVIAGTELWASTGRTAGIVRVATRVCAATGQVSIKPFEQRGWIVDGSGTVRVFDTVALTVTEQAPDAGTYPKADLLAPHLGCLWFNDVENPQNIIATAINDPLDVDMGSPEPGSAFALTTALASQVGEPVRSMTPGAGPVLFVGCSNSTWEILGHPVMGMQVNRLWEDTGTSGPAAAWLCDGGRVLAHSTAGVVVLRAGESYKLSAEVLTGGIQIEDAAATHIVQVIRDPSRHGVLVFLTPREGGAGTGFWYAERVGRYNPVLGGFWPEQYPENVGPTAVALWDGLVVLGGRDGYLRHYDEQAKSDDGEAIHSKLTLALVSSPMVVEDTMLSEAWLIGAEESDPFRLRVYGGVTAQEAFVGAQRWGTVGLYVTDPLSHFTALGRAPFLAMEISNDVAGRSWSLEGVIVDTTPAELTRRRRILAQEPPFPCDAVGGGGGSPGGGSGGSGGDGSGGSDGGGASFASGPGPGSGGSGIGSVVVKGE